MSVPRYHSTGRTAVEILSSTWTGGSARKCWFVAEFPRKEYVFTAIRINNKVAEVLIVETCGHFWRENLPILAWVG